MRDHHPYPLPDIAPSVALAQASRYEAARRLQMHVSHHQSRAVVASAIAAAPWLRHALIAGCLLAAVTGIMLA